MNRDEIMTMEAGRELNKLIAVKVMGGIFSTMASGTPCYVFEDGNYGLPDYSTDIAAAWQVVEKLREKKLYAQLTDCAHDYVIWCCSFYGSTEAGFIAHADTAPLAICRAALLAVMDGEK